MDISSLNPFHPSSSIQKLQSLGTLAITFNFTARAVMKASIVGIMVITPAFQSSQYSSASQVKSAVEPSADEAFSQSSRPGSSPQPWPRPRAAPPGAIRRDGALHPGAWAPDLSGKTEGVHRSGWQQKKSLPTDAKQDLRPNFNFGVFHRGERILLIPISVYPCSLPVTARESSARTLGLTTSLLQARSKLSGRIWARSTRVLPPV